MAVSLLYLPLIHIFDANGNPVPQAKVFSYVAGTSTPKALYADPLGTTPLPNPAIADSGGRLIAYATIGESYKINVTDANDVQLPFWPVDNILVTPFASPTLIDDYSNTVTQHIETMDPGEPGTENLPTNLAEELKQQRFRLGEITGERWDKTYTQRLASGEVTNDAIAGAFTQRLVSGEITSNSTSGDWPATGTSIWFFRHHIPKDWVQGTNINFRLMRRASSAANNVRMTVNVFRVRHNTGITTQASQDIDYVPGDTNSQELNITIAGANYLPGDFMSVQITRLGDDAADTNTGAIAPDGHSFEYTAMTAAGTWPATGTSVWFFRHYIPKGWNQGTNVNFRLMRRAAVATGNVRMTVQVYRVRHGAALATQASQDIDYVPGDLNSKELNITIAGANYLPGDFMVVQINRLGDDANDTNTGVVSQDGHSFEYTGVGGR